MKRAIDCAAWRLAAAVALAPLPAGAYDGATHQMLTFIAAQHFNRCAANADATRLTPLQVRYVVKANVGETEANVFRKITRWNYYDRDGQKERSVLGFIQTRLHQRFNRAAQALDQAATLAERYSNLGRIASYLQEVTSPAHAVPVYTARWWRFNIGDRFDGYPVDEEPLAAALSEDCSPLHVAAQPYPALLAATAGRTLVALREPIADMPATWESFWQIDVPGAFGQYGDAGNNFGRQTDFECDGPERCVLVKSDPIYAAFAAARHADAVRATMTAMWLLQRSLPAAATQAPPQARRADN